MLGSMLDAAITDLPQMPADELLTGLLQSESTTTIDSPDRRGQRVTDSCIITVRPASSSHRQDIAITGRTRDAGPGGVGMLSDRPPAVGDVYLLEFDDSPFQTEQVFARCMHCRLIREDAFESGFAFFAPVPLREA